MNNMSQTMGKKRKLLLWGGFGLAVVVVLAVVLGACLHNSSIAYKWQEQYDLGMRFLSDGDYEQAAIAFEAAISIDARNADAYLALADTYIAMGDLDAAEKVLEDAQSQIEDERIDEKLKSIRELRENQNAELEETPVEEEEPVEEIEEVSLDDITLYIPVVTEAIDFMAYSGDGLLYDMDQDGVEELVLLYSRWVDGEPYQVVSAYDLENGEVVPIVDTLKLMILAGGGSAEAGVVRVDENEYIMVAFDSYYDVSGVTEYRLYDVQTKELTDIWRFVEDDLYGLEGEPNLIYEHNDEECTSGEYYDFLQAIEYIKMIIPEEAIYMLISEETYYDLEEDVTQNVMSLEELLNYLEASRAEDVDVEAIDRSADLVDSTDFADWAGEDYGELPAESGITEEMAYEGVYNYCHSAYDWSIAEDYPDIMYVVMGEESETEYQVIFRSYTSALVYFYVDKSDGTTRITERGLFPDFEESDIGSIYLYDYLNGQE